MNKCHRYINTVPSKCPMLLSTNQSFDIFPHLNQSSLPLRIFRIFFENHIGAQSAVFEINSRFTWVQFSFENVTLFENAVLLSNLQHPVGFCFSFESAQFYSKIVQHFLWSLRRRILIGSAISEACAVFDRPNVKGCTVSKINVVCLSKCLIIPIYFFWTGNILEKMYSLANECSLFSQCATLVFTQDSHAVSCAYLPISLHNT